MRTDGKANPLQREFILKKKIILAVIAWIAVIAWMGVIYSMSADTGTESSEKSGEVVDFVAETVIPGYGQMTTEEKSEVKETISLPIRKLAHISEYLILGVLTTIAVWLTPKLEKRLFRAILPFVISVAYATFDEYHQAFVPGRGPAFTDVCIDAVGVILGVGLVWGAYVVCSLREAKKSRRQVK